MRLSRRVLRTFEERLIATDLDLGWELIRRHRPKFLYTIPNFQNPTGITLARERRAALARIAADEHPEIGLSKGDRVIFSSRTIPGNEKAVSKIVNGLIDQGVEVITDRTHLVHVSALGADAASPSKYARSKAAGEAAGQRQSVGGGATQHGLRAREKQSRDVSACRPDDRIRCHSRCALVCRAFNARRHRSRVSAECGARP